MFPDKVVRVRLIDRKELFTPTNTDCPKSRITCFRKKTRYIDGEHHWQAIKDDWTGLDAHRVLGFSWLGETIFQRQLDKEMISSTPVGDNDMLDWRENLLQNLPYSKIALADVEAEFNLAHREKLEEK